MRLSHLLVLAVFAWTVDTNTLHAQKAAPTPPMGWNSWDSYGITINEQEFLDNANSMALHLRKFGWQYAVVDEGWYVVDPLAKAEDAKFKLDDVGRYTPVESRFPSGFDGLAKKVHSLGLKFGIHLIRGIPKQALAINSRIANSTYTAADAADITDTCPWNTYNYGVKNNPAGQAYYDSLASLYASWGVDYIKIDCISDHPYKGDEIRMISQAIGKTRRPMVLSLSPGPSALEKASELTKWADMWRISDDFWDIWKSDSDKTFPQDLTGQFKRVAAWADYSGNGHWPDADMLPLGHLGPRPGNEKERDTNFNREEQKTVITLWSISRSPLIMGGNLTQMDEWTTSLLTNPEVIAVDQHSSGGKQVLAGDNAIVWQAREGSQAHYIAMFNLGEETRTLAYTWKQLGLPGGPYRVRDLWQQKNLGAEDKLSAVVRAHGSMLLRVEP